MTKKGITGRQKEQAILKERLESKQAEFIAVYGRRRVGKTYLITQLVQKTKCTFLYASGAKDQPLRQQIDNFMISVAKAWGMPKLAVPSSWMQAFQTLTDLMEKSPPRQKIVLFFDELPWMATHKSKILGALDYFWNRYWSHDVRIKLIVCGSSASWIIKNIIYNKGGLYNRITQQLCLQPFSLKETKDFLLSKQIKLSHRHILEIYMATGGIPYYLTYVRKNQSAAQNINEMAFNTGGVLYQDFDVLFSSLFDHADDYVRIVRTIAQHKYGIMQEDLLRQCNLPSGGSAINKLKDLEQAGFIISFLNQGHKKRGKYYRLIDEYCFFYLKWIEPQKKSLQKLSQSSWLRIIETPSWISWAGYNFEAICFKHINQIRRALGLDETATAETWNHRGKGEDQGAQIDLLFDRMDDAITICEIKYTDTPFTINKAYAQNLQSKISIYKKQTNTHKQMFLAFIASAGIKKNLYSEELVSHVVKLDDLFKAHSQ